MVELMTSLLTNSDHVCIRSLGILKGQNRPARMAAIPRRGSIRIAASKKVAFRVAKELKAAVLS
jgi:nucleoid DNA-binding protein